MIVLNSFQATLYHQLSSAFKPLDSMLEEILEQYKTHPTIFSDLLYLLSNISVSNKEAEEYFSRLDIHRQGMELALAHPVDLRVAIMDYFVNVQRRYESPKIIELKDYQENLSMAMCDGLTGLFNRRTMEQLLHNELARSARHRQGFALVFVDIDNFKSYNDTLGHHVGDEILKAFAAFLKAQIRLEDAAARFGGEEFILLLPQTGSAGIERLSRRLLRTIGETHFPENVKLGFSAGVAEFPRDGSTVTDLLQVADTRMYHAKEKGKNRVCLVSSVLSQDGVMSPLPPELINQRGQERPVALA